MSRFTVKVSVVATLVALIGVTAFSTTGYATTNGGGASNAKGQNPAQKCKAKTAFGDALKLGQRKSYKGNTLDKFGREDGGTYTLNSYCRKSGTVCEYYYENGERVWSRCTQARTAPQSGRGPWQHAPTDGQPTTAGEPGGASQPSGPSTTGESAPAGQPVATAAG